MRAQEQLGGIQAWCRAVAKRVDNLGYDDRRLALTALGVKVRIYRSGGEKRWEIEAQIGKNTFLRTERADLPRGRDGLGAGADVRLHDRARSGVPAPAPYDGIGGPHLELLSARYTIEPAGDGTVVLVLESAHRVTTRFNEYSGAWTEFVLADLQGYLLRIVKERAEAARTGRLRVSLGKDGQNPGGRSRQRPYDCGHRRGAACCARAHVARLTGSDGGAAMKALVKAGVIVLVPEAEDDPEAFAAWREAATEHVFVLRAQPRGGTVLHDLGPREEACREPLNVGYRSPDWRIMLISNFAPTPFELDGRAYASVEGLWQGLKFPAEADRRRIAALYAGTAKRAGEAAVPAETFEYEGERTHAHWKLMERACRAKFSQNAEARSALLATGDRPITHVMRRDSTTIPGAIMAEIWMRIRARLQT